VPKRGFNSLRDPDVAGIRRTRLSSSCPPRGTPHETPAFERVPLRLLLWACDPRLSTCETQNAMVETQGAGELPVKERMTGEVSPGDVGCSLPGVRDRATGCEASSVPDEGQKIAFSVTKS
jgi:hypothetical protein